MKFGRVLGVVLAIGVHLGIILFGGIFFKKDHKKTVEIREVDLLGPESPSTEKKPDPEEQKPPEPKDDVEAEAEKPPDSADVIRSMEQASAAANAPALEAASLSSIESALSGGGAGAGGGDFADALSFASGGRIGGTGKAATLEEKFENAFSMSEIDQKPRAVFQASPNYPAELRGKKIEGVVTLIFIVDAAGRVVNPKVEKSSNPLFEKPALEAVRQWKFEPAVKAGARVDSRSRVSIRFTP